MAAWQEAFQNRNDLEKYADNAIGLFALALRFGIDDLETVAADSITDGHDDKKCDMVFVEKDEGYATIAQCYYSSRSRPAAPANKASDINIAIGWLLQRPEKDLPERIRPAAIELRQAINDNQIEDIHLWYVHNLPGSENVRQELITVEHTCDSILKINFPGKRVRIHVLEVCSEKLDEWYEDTQSPILVTESFELPVEKGFEVEGDHWSAFVTTVSGKFLHKAYSDFGAKLFSSNVREYLGSRKSDANINYGIKKSAQDSPGDFWAFNNGITALVHAFKLQGKYPKAVLKFRGFSIINGAQTTGAIGSLSKSPLKSVTVPIRFIVTKNSDTLFDIIQYNNSQNKVTVSDFRSRDRIQKRLREEMEAVPNAEYQGGRRGGASDVIRRNPKLLPSYTVGQSLASVQADPHVAYNQKSEIWSIDSLYSKYFNDDLSAVHIVFSYSLLRCIESRKLDLIAKSKTGEELTDIENRELQYFRQRGATYLLVSAISSCLETIIGKRISNVTRISFGKISPAKAETLWAPIVSICAAFCPHLEDGINGGLNNRERIKKALGVFQSLVSATAASNAAAFKAFASKIEFKQ